MLPVGCELVHGGSTPRLLKKGNLSLRLLSGPLGPERRLEEGRVRTRLGGSRRGCAGGEGVGGAPWVLLPPPHFLSLPRSPAVCSFSFPACLSARPPFVLPSLPPSSPPSSLPLSLPLSVLPLSLPPFLLSLFLSHSHFLSFSKNDFPLSSRVLLCFSVPVSISLPFFSLSPHSFFPFFRNFLKN